MDVVLPLVVLSVPLIALLWLGIRWALRYDRKHRKKREADQGLVDAAFELIIQKEWKKPDA